MMSMLTRILVGLVLATLTSYLAFRARTLTHRGALSAALLGTIVFGLGGLPWAILLLAFFVGSSVLSGAFLRSKQGLSEKYSKGGQRDEFQVLSNGGIAGLFVVLHTLFPASGLPWIAFSAALAAVNADTWATELGVLDPNRPRLVTALGSQVDKGTSGGVSLIGSLASAAASAVIGILAGLFFPGQFSIISATVFAGGIVGSLVDSLLGATLQAMYYCPADQKETEKHPLHSCGTATIHVRGWKWLNNDMVNLVCAASGAAAALVLAYAAGGF